MPSQIDFGNSETSEGGWGRIVSTNVWGMSRVRFTSNFIGSIYTNFQDSDLRKLNIKLGSKFNITFQSGKQFEVKYWTYPFMTEPEGKCYSPSKSSKTWTGSWLCAEDPEGFIVVMINSFKGMNPIGTANAQVGQTLFIEAAKLPSRRLVNKEKS